jgi:hypothetical protein
MLEQPQRPQTPSRSSIRKSLIRISTPRRLVRWNNSRSDSAIVVVGRVSICSIVSCTRATWFCPPPGGTNVSSCCISTATPTWSCPRLITCDRAVARYCAYSSFVTRCPSCPPKRIEPLASMASIPSRLVSS